MNNVIDVIISYLKNVSKKIKLYIITVYNKTYFLINSNFTLSKIYKPIIEEKAITNKKLQETLKSLDHKNKGLENNILKLENKNELLQVKISTIEDLITKRYD